MFYSFSLYLDIMFLLEMAKEFFFEHKIIYDLLLCKTAEKVLKTRHVALK